MRVAIADSNQLVRVGLSSVFKNQTDFELVGEAQDPDSLYELVKSFEIDVITIDFAVEHFSIDVVVKSLEINPKLKLVAITGERNGRTIVNALRAGITSYIKKDCDIQEILDAVRETARGGKFFCGKILDIIRKENIPLEDLDLAEATCDPVLLSARELDVIKLIAEGYTNVQIAKKLFLSSHTVNTHRRNIMQKLGVNNTAAIVMYAVKSDLINPNKFLFAPAQ